MWEVLASILMKNRKWIGSWRDHSVSDYHYYSSELHFIGLDVIKVTLLFSFRLFQSAYVCSFLQNQMWIHNLRGRSISMSASVDGDKLLPNTNRFESKPKCHLSFLFSNPWSGSHPSSFHGPIFLLDTKSNILYLCCALVWDLVSVRMRHRGWKIYHTHSFRVFL